MSQFDPFRVWKTLSLRGAMSAKQLAAYFAALPEERVTVWAEQRVTLALDLLDERGLVEPVGEERAPTVAANARWHALDEPHFATKEERRDHWLTLARAFRDERPPRPDRQ